MINKETKRKIILFFAPRFIWCVMWILYLLNKKEFHIHKLAKQPNAILAFWHGELLMMPFLYRKMRKKRDIFVISSNHFDGELMVKLYGYFGFNTIRGSSSKDGLRALIQSINRLQNGSDVAITPDGPKGPLYSIENGIVAMAQKAESSIVVVRAEFSKYWELKTWDKMRIPKPFGRIKFYALKPFRIDSNLNLNDAKSEIYKHMIEEFRA